MQVKGSQAEPPFQAAAFAAGEDSEEIPAAVQAQRGVQDPTSQGEHPYYLSLAHYHAIRLIIVIRFVSAWAPPSFTWAPT